MSWKYILKERNPFMNKLTKVLEKLAREVRSRGLYVQTAFDLTSKYIRELETEEYLSVAKIEEVLLEALSAPLMSYQMKLQDENFQEKLQDIADLGEVKASEEEESEDTQFEKLTPEQNAAIKEILTTVVNDAYKQIKETVESAMEELGEDLEERLSSKGLDKDIDRVKIEQTKKRVSAVFKQLLLDKQFKITYTLNLTTDMIKLSVIERMVIDRNIPEGDKIYPIETNTFAQIMGDFFAPFPKDFDWVTKSWSNHLRD
tara:strand:- start:2284 stop:3060 length:777 start_codon:yes stop_codon:yes gene_type:complete